jgi:hypothetical protein
MHGTIKILDSCGEAADVRTFSDKGYNTIAEIKKRWKKKYGKSYKEERIVIEIGLVKHEIKDGVVTRIDKRPEAIYSNPSFNS